MRGGGTVLEAIVKHLTIRNLPPDVGRALEREKQRKGTSLNQMVIDLLRRALGVDSPGRPPNGLARLAGTWTAEDLARFEAALAVTEGVDEELWR
jgi:plasmid stability protein